MTGHEDYRQIELVNTGNLGWRRLWGFETFVEHTDKQDYLGGDRQANKKKVINPVIRQSFFVLLTINEEVEDSLWLLDRLHYT